VFYLLGIVEPCAICRELLLFSIILCKKLGILNYDCHQQKHVIFPIEPRIFNPITQKSEMVEVGNVLFFNTYVSNDKIW
jgi:hypothetical protein